MAAAYTPMIQQYLRVKAEYQDAFLFFRLGDFYEMFFDDALKASQELEITLTSREGGTEERIPMCGVPYHSAPVYIEQLIEKGYKVAICEQTEDPKQAKGVVKREVVQLITPGTMMEGKGLQEKENNYIASISVFEDETFGFATNDLSTGETKVTMLSSGFDEVLNELSMSGAKEVVISSDFDGEWQRRMKERSVMAISFEDDCGVRDSFEGLLADLNQDKLRTTSCRLINYLYRTQKRSLDHLQKVATYQINQYMKIDYFSKKNLELTETIRSKGKKGSLLWLLDETKTAMGGRLLKQWIDRPLIDEQEIKRRHSLVETLIHSFFEREEIREKLKEVYDLERLAGRVAFGNVNARDLVQLKKSLQQIPVLKEMVSNLPNEEAVRLAERLDACEEVTDTLESAIMENPPLSLKDGNIIQDGYHEELDKYRDASRNGKTWIAQLEKQEREKTGIKSLKIGFNRVFGYYIEVTRANLHLLKEGQYERKQTLTNAERFITPELKEKESLILEAQEKCVELEYELFTNVREHVKEFIPRLQKLAKTLSELDVLQCFSAVSEQRHYIKPSFSNERRVYIKDGRHPVVEKVLNAQEYVPNDCYMDADREVLLITGPNMSGKSTYMRQIALTAILAQIGCYVPASEAVLPIFDQVFTRIGAADDLISGQSTFMVEMLEARNAIVNATQNSLILFDEIGRGTSTYDGMALAQAIIEYIHDRIGAKTLFSTHYHELTVLEEELQKVKNIHVSAVEQNGRVVFLHKIKEGAADKSYGIHVAQLAELPNELIVRANEILTGLESNDSHPMKKEIPAAEKIAEPAAQLSFFEEPEDVKKPSIGSKEKKIIDKVKALDILDMTPMQALNTLYELHRKLKN
ncbi:DNA mismatch repair protein MutS [Cytobacillus firmus]|uniref:DNA mismatch repair protein MutS n=2 Tax=Cytobacillus firmus TaxID=1399 RepID=UPI0018CDA712|nr:DNA mismatch repair protein MutS [Cytobacillus firmus]MBG9542039.1 DNA mismatch repair protein MutS [Cytobacillus firmus]MBG9548055.1 DNA mismatch repair protein MutS [Cytobacillus firmus]MBG9551647.1 DNA mismatch repair protein MutS [Cytobacillus firmus]MBG9576065.1 DNA mismatch repair protein MutS [Cytobacillus firmus]MBG9601795.1 DNA mismatch repair protein MutS [Cytobacillus firmus]